LEADGYACEAAADGKDALWKAFMKDFDLVLMDVKMPGISGMEALPQMVTNHPDTCVVMMTAVVDTETAVEAMKLGAYDYITKPFDLDDLGMRVEKALERRKLILENRDYQRRLELRVKQHSEQVQHQSESVEARPSEQSASEAAAKPRKEFSKKISQLFNKTTTDSPDEGSDVMSSTAKTEKKPQEEVVMGQKEREGLALYQGAVELEITSPVGLHQLLLLNEHLRSMGQAEVLGVGGSLDKDVTIRLRLKTPAPLLEALRNLPEVVQARDGLGEAEMGVAAQQGGAPQTRKITVSLSSKPVDVNPKQ
jgi:DNA-binding response OmpR family regulator